MALISSKYYDRDLSWLRFNHRVLQEAADSRNPLYERIKFLAIFSSNLDEFFKVRVSDIRQIKQLDKSIRKKLITKPNKLLKRIKKQVNTQQEEFGRIYREEIVPALRDENILLISHRKFQGEELPFVEDFFEKELSDKLHVFHSSLQDGSSIFIENEALYLTALMADEKVMWVKIDNQRRFIQLPMNGEYSKIAFVDDILKHNLFRKFKTDFYAIKISRDAELYIDNEYSGNLLEKIKDSLSNRDTGQVTRILTDSQMPEPLLQHVMSCLDINETDVVPGGVYHNLKDFFGLPNPKGNSLGIY